MSRVRVQLARQVVWAWHLGVIPSIVELDFVDPSASFIDFGELWHDDTWLAAMWTASLCASDCEHGPGPGSVESQTVQETLAWAAALEGSRRWPEPECFVDAERQLRASVQRQLERPRLAAAVDLMTQVLCRHHTIDARDIARLLSSTLELGAGRRQPGALTSTG